MKYLAYAALAVLISITAGRAHAETPPGYFSLMGGYVFTDDVRGTDEGIAWHALVGKPLSERLSLEIGMYGQQSDLKALDKKDYALALGSDLRAMLAGSDRLGLFALGGLGIVYEDFVNAEEISPYLNLGIGALAGWSRFQFRLEGRYLAIFNDRHYPTESVIYEPRVNLGFQVSFGRAAVRFVDSDGDGVTDDRDACPGTPRGTPVDANGCPLSLDDDNDGVPNDRDACPGTPPGTLVDHVGCPVAIPVINPDSDNDGVPDSADLCPNTPPGFKVDATGCIVKEQTVIVLNNVAFEFDSSKLTHEARLVLDNVVAGLSAQPSVSVEIAGHTDSLGTQAYNLQLSQARAASVRNFLVSRGIDGSRLRSEGYGEFNPIDDNNTEEGRARNRRVEFKILTQ